MKLWPHQRSRVVWAVVACLAAAGLWAAWAYWSQPRLNVILVTLDTTRADHLGCYGAAEALTPQLDRLASEGVLFERVYTTAPLTLPAHASMFTGLYPPEHGLRTNGKHRLSDDVPTLAEAFLSRGYETGAFVASFVVHSKFGLNRGFQTYDDDLTGTIPTDEALHRSRDGDVVMDRALAWLKGRSQRPFFCWIHLYDPHAPYLDHRDRFGDRFVEHPYDAEIAFVDEQIGRLLQHLRDRKLEQNTLVMVIGDHGEGLEQHQERRHGQMLYNSTLHVPWIVRRPGKVPERQKITTPVSVADVYPTLIEAAKLKGASRISGRSQWAAVGGKEAEPRPLYSETNEPLLESGWSSLRSLISANWKYIRTPKVELYDLAQDPAETRNLANQESEQVQSLERQLADLEAGLQSREGGTLQLSSVDIKKLSGLGYIGHAGKVESLAVNPDLPDIKDMTPAYNTVEDARELLDAGKYDDAEALLKKLLADKPDVEYAEVSLGDIYLRQQKFDEAAAIYRSVLKRNPESAICYVHLGDIGEATGRFDEALQNYQLALDRQPDSAKLHYNTGRVLVLLQRDDEAIGHFQQTIELDPGYVFAHIELGSAWMRQGRLASALVEYEVALQYDANSVFAHMNAANVLSQMRRGDEVLPHLEQAANIAPQDVEVQFQLGAFLAHQGQLGRARSQLERVLKLAPDHGLAKDLLQSLGRGGK